MKRNDAVAKIADYLRGCDFDGLSEEELFDESGYLLSILEKSNMSSAQYLIEAAPDLLTVCERIINDRGIYRDDGTLGIGILMDIHQAVKKAKGEKDV